ncbi:hypothetical protein [Cetobacterium sp.]|uniref:hypothetical protein n=1 Tax=Cetobacterium sp. TaxID=2071632 RepID=UPI003EE4E526
MKEAVNFLTTLEGHKILKLSSSKQENDLHDFINKIQTDDKDKENLILLLSRFSETIKEEWFELGMHYFENKKNINK